MDYRVLVSELSPIQRYGYTQTPEAGFFDAFAAAYEQLQPAESGSTPANGEPSAGGVALADVLGATQAELADIRGVGADQQRQYAAILYAAYASGGMTDPQQFLRSLSASDLDVVRRIRGLADTIVPGTLSDEGASNLLLPEGYSVDLDGNGIDEIGIGKTLHFPPRDAPAEFTAAWFEATKDMDFGGYATASMTFLLAFHPPVVAGVPFVALPSSQLTSYQTVTDNYLSMLETFRGMLPDGQYERDHPFFSRLKELLDPAG